MPISSRRQTAPTARPKAKTAATTPLLDPSKRIVTARLKQAQAIARFLWRHRREPNLWLSLLVAAEVLVLLGLLIAYQALSV